jgi:hypothetical protein
MDPLPDLHRFTLDFFAFFDAAVRPLDRRKQGALEVTLPAELAEHFGRPQLRLAFHQVTPGSDLELVAHGSRMFDRMLSYLDRRGALTLLELPNRYPSSETLLSTVRPLNASITGLKLQEQVRPLYVFDWRITYRADDKREELYTVLLDDQGERLPLAGEGGAGRTGVDPQTILDEALPVAPESGPDGLPLLPKLPPMTQLVRMAEAARKYAIYHADLRCVTHEAEILPRLYRTLNRLTTYYGQQIQEVYDSHDPTGEKRQALEEDLARKIAEEVENHRLHVEVKLIGYAVVQTPVAVANMTLTDGAREAPLQVVHNRYSGVIHGVACHACDRPSTTVALDRNGHICCDDCVRQCATCHAIVCAACGVAPCPVCGRDNCADCGRECWACGERACAEHLQICPVCGDTVCLACQTPCAVCGTVQCRSHLRADGVAGADGGHALICGACAVRCPGCQQYSAQVRACSASGQRFCANCLVVCADCGREVGPGFYERDLATQRAFCHNCLIECPTCQTMTPATVVCAACGKTGCRTCATACRVCRQYFCADHIHTYAECGHAVCAAHGELCAHCRQPVCPVCHEACGVCERHFCHTHADVCRRCEQVYCRECVQTSGLCVTCAGLEPHGIPVQLTEEACMVDERVAAMAPHYRWRRLSNARFVIFVGENSFLSRAVVVVAKDAGRRVVTARRLSAIDRLRDQFGKG